MRRVLLVSFLVVLGTIAIRPQAANAAGDGSGLTRSCDHYTVIYRTANECLKGKCRSCQVYLNGEPYSTMGPHCEWVECGIEQRVSLPLLGLPSFLQTVQNLQATTGACGATRL